MLSELLFFFFLPPAASPPHRSGPPSASICRQRIFPNLGPSSNWDRTRGTRSGCPKVARSRNVPAESSRWRTRSHVACVGSCMYVHTNIHTYIHICIFLYIDIYSAIFFFFWSWYKGNENHSLFVLSLGRKISRSRKIERSRPFRVNFEILRKITISKKLFAPAFRSAVT